MATRKKKQTLAEFRAWLSGVEELQPADWAPNAAQWKTIREKIDSIAEPKASTADADMLQKLIETLGNNTPRPAMPQNPVAMGIPPAPPPPAGVPAGPVDVAPAAQPQPAAVPLPPAKPIDIVEAAKPKDTSDDGKYESGFI